MQHELRRLPIELLEGGVHEFQPIGASRDEQGGHAQRGQSREVGGGGFERVPETPEIDQEVRLGRVRRARSAREKAAPTGPVNAVTRSIAGPRTDIVRPSICSSVPALEGVAPRGRRARRSGRRQKSRLRRPNANNCKPACKARTKR